MAQKLLASVGWPPIVTVIVAELRLQPGLGQNLEQGLRMSPQLRQSLRLLQAPTQELSQLLRHELEHNPVLEAELPNESLAENGFENDEFEAEDQRANSIEQRWLDDLREERILAGRHRSHDSQLEERRQRLFDSQSAAETLQQHLLAQLGALDMTPAVRSALLLLIERLDDDGRLADDLEDLALQLRQPLAPLEQALQLLRSLDPPGLGARDLRECLLLQAERLEESDPVAIAILRDHFDLLARNRRKDLARILRLNPARLSSAIDWIRRLSPHPARAWSHSTNREVRADAVLRRAENDEAIHGWRVELPDDNLPRLRLNPWYKDLLATGDESTRNWLRNKMRDGSFMIRALAQRQQTLQRVAEEILRRQPDWPRSGLPALRPMTMAQVADALDLHETTVSRAVAGKYIQTPVGLFEMRRLFSTGLARSPLGDAEQVNGHEIEAKAGGNDDEISSEAARSAIAELIQAENRSKPLSDNALVQFLQDRGITIARRTVAKYREQLGIPPSNLRRE